VLWLAVMPVNQNLGILALVLQAPQPPLTGTAQVIIATQATRLTQEVFNGS
jgi:hypothetical protein